MRMRGIPGFPDPSAAPRAILESMAALRVLDRKQAALCLLELRLRGGDDLPKLPVAQ
jgi:hypothetical protein